MTGTLDQWRARIDELKVQVDLAKLDTRERATKQLDMAQNACMAAYSKLRMPAMTPSRTPTRSVRV